MMEPVYQAVSLLPLQVLTNPSYGPRPGVPKVIILITDGVPTFSVEQLPAIVSQIKNAGIRIVTVGVTNMVCATLESLFFGHLDFEIKMRNALESRDIHVHCSLYNGSEVPVTAVGYVQTLTLRG